MINYVLLKNYPVNPCERVYKCNLLKYVKEGILRGLGVLNGKKINPSPFCHYLLSDSDICMICNKDSIWNYGWCLSTVRNFVLDEWALQIDLLANNIDPGNLKHPGNLKQPNLYVFSSTLKNDIVTITHCKNVNLDGG